jgi:hypothetical protein
MIQGQSYSCSEALIIFGIYEYIAILMKFGNIRVETGVSSMQQKMDI